jgi:predicted small integral membrane protein
MDISTTEFVFRLIPLLILVGTTTMGAIICLNNVTAPRANFQFVEHVLSMDTTHGEEGIKWRAVRSSGLHRAAYVGILALEGAVTVLGVVGSFFLVRDLTVSGAGWDEAKLFAYLTFLVALLIWFFIFQVVGAEWFVSWQSENWNAIRDSIRINLISVAGVILLRLA